MELGDNDRLISVIITVYNREDFIGRAIDSILGQKDVDSEIIIVDDGSTDRSLNICNDYAEKFQNVRVIHQENAGLSKARNVGLDNARGDYICFLDDDDVMTPGSLKHMLDAIEEYDADFVLGSFIRVSEDGEVVTDNKMPDYIRNRVITVDEYWEASFEKIGVPLFVVNWAKLYRKQVWEGLRYPDDLRRAEDEYIMADLLKRCKRIYATDYIVHHQAVSKSSITRCSFCTYTLKVIETKLVTTEKLMEQGKYKYAVSKWGVPCGEVLIYTGKAATEESKAELNRLYKWSCDLGKKLFKHMDFKKKLKFLGYRFGYPFYKMTHKAR